MLDPKVIHILPYDHGHIPCSIYMRRVGRELFRFRLLKSLRPHIRKIFSVTEPAGRVWLQSKPQAEPHLLDSSLTVISANLWHDWPRHRRLAERIDAFANLAKTERADLLLLQEVARTSELRADERLAEQLGMDYIYSRVNGHERIGFEEGLALYSRFPICNPKLRDLGKTCNPFSRRLALGAEVKTPQGSLTAISTHLGLTRGANAAQMAHLHSWVNDLAGDTPALIGGDFNAPESTRQIEEVRKTWLDTFRNADPVGDGATHTLRWPWGGLLSRERLDYIFLLPGKWAWKVIESRLLETPGLPHSDHLAVLTRLAPVYV